MNILNTTRMSRPPSAGLSTAMRRRRKPRAMSWRKLKMEEEEMKEKEITKV
jgi:hypothetical protein